MTNRRLRKAIEEACSNASYLFGYATRAKELKGGSDPFYNKMQTKNAEILEIFGPVLEALPSGEQQEIRDWIKQKYAIGESTAERVVGKQLQKES